MFQSLAPDSLLCKLGHWLYIHSCQESALLLLAVSSVTFGLFGNYTPRSFLDLVTKASANTQFHCPPFVTSSQSSSTFCLLSVTAFHKPSSIFGKEFKFD